MKTKQSLSFGTQNILLWVDCAYSFRTGWILEPVQIQAILENKHPSVYIVHSPTNALFIKLGKV